MNRNRYVQENTARMEKILKTSATSGLSEEEAAKRLKANGRNRTVAKRTPAVLSFLTAIICSGSLPLFLLAFLIAYPRLGEDVLFSATLYLVFLAVLLLLFVLRERLLCVHESSLLPYVRVMRGGRERTVSPECLVTGDLLLLSPGDVLYTYAHVVTDDEIEAVCERDGKHKVFIKHGGDCFEECEEAFNLLCPGDKLRGGGGRAFVTEKCDPASGIELFAAETLKSRGKMCRRVTRITYFLAFLMLFCGFLKACIVANTKAYGFLSESLLLSVILISTASTAFYPLFFDLLFLIRNRRGARTVGASFASAEIMETVAGVDALVLPTRAMFSKSGYDVRYFETASGRRFTEKMRGGAELALIADALCATREKCPLDLKENAVLRFSAKHSSRTRRITLSARSVEGSTVLSSYRDLGEGRSFSLVYGDALSLISSLSYAIEEGKARRFDAGAQSVLADRVSELEKDGYHVYLFAEAQAVNAQAGMPASVTDLKLLGFFALRRMTDALAAQTLSELEEAGKKVLFLHDGESAEWLSREIPALRGVPILDGESEKFREGMACFAKDELLTLCIGIRLSPKQRAQVVAALEAAGRTVAVAGTSFEDHRMMYDATVSVVPPQEDERQVPPLLAECSAVRAKEHISSYAGSVKNAAQMLSAFDIFTAALCASLIGRAIILLLGVIFGNTFLTSGYYALIGIVFDLLALFCFALADNRRSPFGGKVGVLYEGERSISLFVGFIAGSVMIGLFASLVRALQFMPESFVFLSFLLMLNVGIWYFSVLASSAAVRLYSVVSVLLTVIFFLLHSVTNGRIGFPFDLQLVFWALIPVVVMIALGKGLEMYFMQKNNFKVGDKNERM